MPQVVSTCPRSIPSLAQLSMSAKHRQGTWPRCHKENESAVFPAGASLLSLVMSGRVATTSERVLEEDTVSRGVEFLQGQYMRMEDLTREETMAAKRGTTSEGPRQRGLLVWQSVISTFWRCTTQIKARYYHHQHHPTKEEDTSSRWWRGKRLNNRSVSPQGQARGK